MNSGLAFIFSQTHSKYSFYGADCEESVIATAEYGAPLTAAVADGNVYGMQFHPEKSGEVGLSILKAFCEI